MGPDSSCVRASTRPRSTSRPPLAVPSRSRARLVAAPSCGSPCSSCSSAASTARGWPVAQRLAVQAERLAQPGGVSLRGAPRAPLERRAGRPCLRWRWRATGAARHRRTGCRRAAPPRAGRWRADRGPALGSIGQGQAVGRVEASAGSPERAGRGGGVAPPTPRWPAGARWPRRARRARSDRPLAAGRARRCRRCDRSRGRPARAGSPTDGAGRRGARRGARLLEAIDQPRGTGGGLRSPCS